ncbi:MAG: efflux RND transporter periplasmic adaptor subunit [Methylovulum miyakonense]|uniref:efflux RND transporter periplasmic adaptor subunit n=1 Tax=Methylovulum miyakonense TaxID=645578 RepID=UPI003BB805FC
MAMRHYSLLFISVLLLNGCTAPTAGEAEHKQSSTISTENVKPSQAEPAGLQNNDKQNAISIPMESRPYITVAEVTPQIFAATVQAPCRVEFRAKALSTVGAVVAGRLGKINVQVGDRVKAGTPIATLESPEAARMRADVARAKAELQRAEDRAKRQAIMQKSGVGLEIERTEANIQLRQAQSDYARSLQAVRLLGEGSDQSIVLHAPIAGVVLRVNASIGAAVEAGAVLFELGEPGALWIVADVFDNDLALIEKGAKATLQISALPEPITGRIAAISAAMQSDLRRGAVYIELDNTHSNLKPGMFARASIEAAGPRRIVLPTTAVLIKDKKQTVVYVETADGQFEPRNVVIGQARDGQVPVLDGLAEGERLVTSGALLLDSAAALLL